MKVSDSRSAGGESEGSVDEGEWEQRGRVRVRARVRVRVRVRMRRNLRDRGCMDCADVEIEPLALLLHRTELFIVAEALDGLAHRLVLALSSHVELLSSDESDQRVASLQNDRQRGVGVTCGESGA